MIGESECIESRKTDKTDSKAGVERQEEMIWGHFELLFYFALLVKDTY